MPLINYRKIINRLSASNRQLKSRSEGQRISLVVDKKNFLDGRSMEEIED